MYRWEFAAVTAGAVQKIFEIGKKAERAYRVHCLQTFGELWVGGKN